MEVCVVSMLTSRLKPGSIRGAASSSIMQYTSNICQASLALHHTVRCNLQAALAVRPHQQQQYHCTTGFFACSACHGCKGGMSHGIDKEG
jgi:hypothetical protein